MDCDGGVGNNAVYRGSMEPVLVLLSDLYLDEDRILGK